jgi:DNA repair ATPase RecN
MKNKIFFLVVFAFMAGGLIAENLVLEDEPGGAATVATAAKPAATPAPVKEKEPSVDAAKVQALSAAIAEIKSKQEALASSLSSAQDDLKMVEERSSDIEGLSRDINSLKQRLDALENRDAGDKAAIDKALKDIDSLKDSIKDNIDKLQGWNDIIDVLKKSIGDNETEIAGLKKIINGLKDQYGVSDDSPVARILKWPYAGFSAMLVSIIALGIAVAKK